MDIYYSIGPRTKRYMNTQGLKGDVGQGYLERFLSTRSSFAELMSGEEEEFCGMVRWPGSGSLVSVALQLDPRHLIEVT